LIGNSLSRWWNWALRDGSWKASLVFSGLWIALLLEVLLIPPRRWPVVGLFSALAGVFLTQFAIRFWRRSA
jgi:hypothetical protein